MFIRADRWPMILGRILATSFAALPMSTHAQAPPTRLTVVDQGSRKGPDVIFIPGLTSSRAVWDAEAARLKRGYRLHLIQVNGFGTQPAGANAGGGDLLPAIVDELHGYIAARHMRPVVIGHSLGGVLGLMLARKYPQDVSKLIVVDALPFIGLMTGPQATVASAAAVGKAMSDGLLVQDPTRRAANEKSVAETLARTPEGRERVVADGLASDPNVAAAAMLADFQTDLRPDLPMIATPTLVLYAYDPTLIFPGGYKPTQAMADAITASAYKGMPNAKLVRINDSRHFIMYDQPQVFARYLEGFIHQ